MEISEGVESLLECRRHCFIKRKNGAAVMEIVSFVLMGYEFKAKAMSKNKSDLLVSCAVSLREEKTNDQSIEGHFV